MARTIGEAIVKVRGDTSALSGDVRAGAHRAGTEAGSSMKKAFAGAIAGIGALFAAAGIVDFFKDSIAEQRESIRVGKLTAAVLKSTGGAAKVTATQVGDLATSLSNLSGIDDEVIQQGENVLLTFTNIRNGVGRGNDVFNQATTAALDLSVAMGQDLQSSVVQVGKALNDPIKGMTALQRVGVTFSAEQKKQIEGFIKSNNLMGAQKVILAELNKEFGGAAAAAADPAQKAAVAWKNFEEQIGGILLPKLNELATWFTTVGLPKVTEFSNRLGTLFDKVGPAVNTFKVSASGVFKDLELPDATIAKIKLLAESYLPELRSEVSGVTATLKSNKEGFEQVNDAVTRITNLLGPFVEILGSARGGMFLLSLSASELGATIGGLGQFWTEMKSAFQIALQIMSDSFFNFAKTFIGTAAATFGWIPGIGPKLKEAARQFEAFQTEVNKAIDGITAAKTIALNVQYTSPVSTAGVKFTGPRVGFYAEGGMVPGPYGAPQLAVVHGGEQVRTPEQQNAPIRLDDWTITRLAQALSTRPVRVAIAAPGWDLGVAGILP
jgi:phage-related protein